jgi:hypothetical protein
MIDIILVMKLAKSAIKNQIMLIILIIIVMNVKRDIFIILIPNKMEKNIKVVIKNVLFMLQN